MTDSWDTIADWYADLLGTGSATHELNRDVLLGLLPEDLRGRQVLDARWSTRSTTGAC